MSSPRPMQSPSDTSSWMTLRWVRGTRYYRVHLEQDLWNEWLVIQVCRRIGLGCALAPPAPSIESAFLQLAEIAKRRRQRGYQMPN